MGEVKRKQMLVFYFKCKYCDKEIVTLNHKQIKSLVATHLLFCKKRKEAMGEK